MIDDLIHEKNLEAEIKRIDEQVASLRNQKRRFEKQLADMMVKRTGHCNNCFGKGEYENNHNGDWTECWCPFGQEKLKLK